jgi:GT2 family glycosyltransferase
LNATASARCAERPSVTLIIANLNGKRHLQPCLDSIAALDYERELIDVVVVDNASTDGSLELLAESYPVGAGAAPGDESGLRRGRGRDRGLPSSR